MNIDFVYQVRVIHNDYNYFIEDDDKFDFDTFEEAFELFNNYKKEKGENVYITKTPSLNEDECNELGIEYDIVYVMEK